MVGHLKCAVYIKFFGGQKGGSLEPPQTPPAYGPDDALFSMTIGTDIVTIMFKNYIKQRICSLLHLCWLSTVTTFIVSDLFSSLASKGLQPE